MAEIETKIEPRTVRVLEPGEAFPPVPVKPKIPADSVLVRASSETTGIALLIEKAIETGRPIAELVQSFEKALEIQARQQFAVAMDAFRRECPAIPKARWANMTGRDSDQSWGFSYAPIEVIDEVIRPILGRHGLTYRFVQDKPPADGLICTECVVRHVGGHEERTPSWAVVGNNQKISASQNLAVGDSFARRRALTAAFGLVTTDNFDNEEALAMMQAANRPPPAKAAREAIQPPRRKPDATPRVQSEPNAWGAPRSGAATFTPRPASESAGEFASDRQVESIRRRADYVGISEFEVCRRFELEAFAKIPRAKVNEILAYLEKLAT